MCQPNWTFIWSWITTALTKRRRSALGLLGIRGSMFTSPRPRHLGSIKSNAGSRRSLKNRFAAARIARPDSWKTPSASTSKRTTLLRVPSVGPNPLMTSWRASNDFVCELLTHDTRCSSGCPELQRRRPLASVPCWWLPGDWGRHRPSSHPRQAGTKRGSGPRDKEIRRARGRKANPFDCNLF